MFHDFISIKAEIILNSEATFCAGIIGPLIYTIILNVLGPEEGKGAQIFWFNCILEKAQSGISNVKNRCWLQSQMSVKC